MGEGLNVRGTKYKARGERLSLRPRKIKAMNYHQAKSGILKP